MRQNRLQYRARLPANPISTPWSACAPFFSTSVVLSSSPPALATRFLSANRSSASPDSDGERARSPLLAAGTGAGPSTERGLVGAAGGGGARRDRLSGRRASDEPDACHDPVRCRRDARSSGAGHRRRGGGESRDPPSRDRRIDRHRSADCGRPRRPPGRGGGGGPHPPPAVRKDRGQWLRLPPDRPTAHPCVDPRAHPGRPGRRVSRRSAPDGKV